MARPFASQDRTVTGWRPHPERGCSAISRQAELLILCARIGFNP
jgi:hypothetical protein